MNTYQAEYEYYKGTMDTPWCLFTGDTEVVASSEKDAKQALVTDAKIRGIDNLNVTKLTKIESGD